MTPARIVLRELADARRAGESFEAAWQPALGAALRSVADPREHSAWAKVLAGMVETWRDAFERRPARAPELAMSVVAEDRELAIR